MSSKTENRSTSFSMNSVPKFILLHKPDHLIVDPTVILIFLVLCPMLCVLSVSYLGFSRIFHAYEQRVSFPNPNPLNPPNLSISPVIGLGRTYVSI